MTQMGNIWEEMFGMKNKESDFKLENKALQLATIAHEGQFRKGTGEPYIVHPKTVAESMEESRSKAIALLHDVVEDTSITYDTLDRHFDKKIVEGVKILTRDVNNKEYKKRLASAPKEVQLIKICDTLDNLKGLEYLSENGRKKKINDSLEFYIPLALKLNRKDLATEMNQIMDSYFSAICLN